LTRILIDYYSKEFSATLSIADDDEKSQTRALFSGREHQTGSREMKPKLGRAISIAIGFALCFAAGVAFNKYVGLQTTLAFAKAPAARLRILRREWNSFQQLQYTLDQGDVYPPRYVETGLLPLVLTKKRLSDSYPVAKYGGAITIVGATVVIVDRLGSFYRYDLKTASFGKLQLPPLPNNLEAYLRERRNLGGVRHGNLAGVEAQDEFRAHDVTFLSDRNELAVAYDRFDDTLGKLRTVVSVIPIDVATLVATGDWQTKFTSDPYAPGTAPFAGGRMAYQGKDKLYLSLGDQYIYEPPVAQDPNTTFGKIVEVDLLSKKWRQISMGHRNPQGLAFIKSGQLIATENGPRGGDGLSIITEGSNYGWPNVSLGTGYGSYEAAPDGRTGTRASLVGRIDDYTAPLFAWLPSVAPTQLIQIENFNSRWDGDLLVGSLKGTSLYRIRLQAGRVLYSEPIRIGQRIRDLAQTNNGTIVLWTDDAQLMFVSVDTDKLGQKLLGSAFLGEIQTAGCLGCHHFGPTHPGDPAPTLSNLLNRPIASDVFPYSTGLRGKQGTWTKALLIEFLTDPTKFASGTVMPSMRMLGLSQEQVEEIADTLAQASQSPSAKLTSPTFTGSVQPQ
jgi:glucose/arabinose dehydrogenase